MPALQPHPSGAEQVSYRPNDFGDHAQRSKLPSPLAHHRIVPSERAHRACHRHRERPTKIAALPHVVPTRDSRRPRPTQSSLTPTSQPVRSVPRAGAGSNSGRPGRFVRPERLPRGCPSQNLSPQRAGAALPIRPAGRRECRPGQPARQRLLHAATSAFPARVVQRPQRPVGPGDHRRFIPPHRRRPAAPGAAESC